MSSNKKEIMEKKNRRIKGTLIGIVIAIVLIVIFLFLGGYFSKERRLTKSITNLGSSFYTDFYYDKVSKNQNKKETENFLKQFEQVGIIVSLHNIEKYNSKNNENDLKKLKDAKCDFYKTTVTIYPKNPYKKDNYTMKASLSCDTLK